MQTLKVKHGLILGLISYVLFLIATLPANWLLNHLTSEKPGQLQISGVTGSVWSGQAKAVRLKNIYVTDLKWRWQLSSLWRLNWRYKLDGKLGAGTLQTIAAPLANPVVIHSFRANLPLTDLAAYIQVPEKMLQGQMVIQMPEARFTDDWVTAISGEVRLDNLTINIASSTYQLGNYSGQLSYSNDDIKLVFQDNNAALKTNGTALLKAGGTYQVTLNVLPVKPDTQNLANTLNLIARPDASGSFRLQQHGRF